MKWLETVKERYESVIIAILQYLFLLYYITYEGALFSTDYILICSLIVLLIGVGLHFFFNGLKISKCMALIIIGAIWLFLCAWINGSGFGSAITQTTLLLSICLFSEISLTKKQQKRITARMFVMISLIIIIFFDKRYASYYSTLFYFSKTTYINANCIAIMWLFWFIYVCKLIYLCDWRKKIKNFLYGFCGSLSVVFILLTEARSSLIAWGLFCFLCIYFFVKRDSEQAWHKWYLTALLCSIGIVLIYLLLYRSGFLVGEEFFGKNIYTGRQRIWFEALNRFKDNILFGFSNKITYTELKFQSAHNSLLAIMANFGIVSLLLHIVVLFHCFKQLSIKKKQYCYGRNFMSNHCNGI